MSSPPRSPRGSPRTPSSIRVPRGSVERTPDPVNDPENDPFRQTPNRPPRVRSRNNNNNNNNINSVRRRINFNSIPNTPSPPRASTSTQPIASPSPRSKIRKLQETKTTNYLAKLMKRHKISNTNNKQNYVTINKNSPINIKNKVKDPVFLLSDVYESRDGKVKIVYSKQYLESAWKNRTIIKSPTTGIRSDKSLMVRYNPRIHQNKVIVSKRELNRYKEDKKLIITTIGEETYNDRYVISNIKNNIQKHVLNFIKFIHKKHTDISRMVVDLLLVPRSLLRNFTVAYLDLKNKSELTRAIKVYKKLEKINKKPIPDDEIERYKHEISRIMYIFYLRAIVINEISMDILKNFYRLLKAKPTGKYYLKNANLSIFSDIINFPPN